MPNNSHGQPIGETIETWSARPRPSRAPMEGRFCHLEPLEARHADPLFAAYNGAQDGRDWTYLFVERFDDLPAYRSYVAGQAASDDPLHYAIIEYEQGRPGGSASFMRIDPANGVIEIGNIAFSPLLQRKPAGTEALYLMMRRAFDELGYRRLEWKCDSCNAPSRRAALRYGFIFEGIFRQAVVTKGRNRDTAWYAIIDKDWPALRAAFESWLSADNFDSDGSQKKPLSAFRSV